MINKVIELSLRNKFIVLAVFLLIIGWGYWALNNTPIDAIPDIGENQQIVFVDWPGRSPKDIEDQVIYPLTVNLTGIPGTKVIRSNSMFSFGMVNVIFEEGVDFQEGMKGLLSNRPDFIPLALMEWVVVIGIIIWFLMLGFYLLNNQRLEMADS